MVGLIEDDHITAAMLKSWAERPGVTGESILITDPQGPVIREIDRVDSVVPKARQRRRNQEWARWAGQPEG